ncbi:hypothetical protein TVAG_480630 [Trichomonas vaginalis G3]|uniref:Uncharacterized protein n=1 Tax=Trichomonas vaginalis (strain ATCC PRA-98 / G3) TaxID=412133 RepID=A2FLG3_TRIV3|nr:hypothetical protein TVAGG3_0907650 [Trichomonas vaginalis G3]EAX94246.1 hypothetical protein TVAG_480630 [Trichomonas vaginalis G3]KAI5484180.1 hypothetical protein TVAGG3_0907650 [Trichomonas vaginalis G3]|eukprot:XP_001307176.1 hypothetical protein [Trichomonas vaginalis G3]
MARKPMPEELMKIFFQGVQENPDDNKAEWKSDVELRPSRLGLGADPNKAKKTATTKQERKIEQMIKKDQKPKRSKDDSSSSDEGESRASLGKKK